MTSRIQHIKTHGGKRDERTKKKKEEKYERNVKEKPIETNFRRDDDGKRQANEKGG